ncbi:hypothetical protein TNCV_4231061 [Trichonephila clavipes]|uniref:Uncharacterized protein n=1 Tax=Trichonephila clavipes TaxID=2585209 RepID=A0A8X6SM95_TRICX|nr:hypothetical protein TNCV_4231061 [Trichonephila clavipes]
MDELTEMHEQEQIIEEFETLNSVQLEDRMTVGNLTEGTVFHLLKFKVLTLPFSRGLRNGVPVQMTSSPFDHGSKLLGPSPTARFRMRQLNEK